MVSTHVGFDMRATAGLFALFAVGAFVPGGAPAAGAPSVTVVIQGPITSMAKNGFDVESAGGYVHVTFAPHTIVQRRTQAVFGNIKTGDYVGTTAHKESNGSLTALSIDLIQTDLRPKIPEGQSTEIGGEVVTNGVVAESVTAPSGRLLVVKYQNTTVRIAVPAAAKIARLAPDVRANLRVRRQVSVRGVPDPDANLVADSITLEPNP